MQATVIEINAETVDGAINAVRSALAQGLSWVELERLIRDEREAGNPIAGLIRKLTLEKNKITVELPDWVDEGLEVSESDSGNSGSADHSDDDSNADKEEHETVNNIPSVLVCC